MLFNPRMPQLSGSIHVILKHNSVPDQHRFDFLPLIDLKSTDPNCMYTTLDYISDTHKKLKLPGIPIVTFVQPLWRLAMIVKNQMSLQIVILLGNLHTQLSYQAALGYLMKNSGLAEALATVYSDVTVKNILGGKSYERAMRAHSLASTAMKKILFEQIDPASDDMNTVNEACSYFESIYLNEDGQEIDLQSVKDKPIVVK